MSKINLLALLTANPAYKQLATHLFLLILWHRDSPKEEVPESFDDRFFDRVAWQVGETSQLLGDALRKKLGIYTLETGSLAAHHEYFRTIARGLAEEDSLRPMLLEMLLQTLEADGSYEGTRPCPEELIQVIAGISQQAGGRSYYDPLTALSPASCTKP